MRSGALIVLVTVSLLFCASVAVAETVEVSLKHFSVNLPSGWTDTTEAGGEYTLSLAGPLGVICFVVVDDLPGDDSFDNLNDLMEEVVAGVEDEGYSVSFSVATQNITVNGVKGIDTTISMTLLTTVVKERIVVFGSEDWDLAYVFIFAGLDPGFSQADSGMDSIVNSFSVDEKEEGSGILSGATLAILGVGIIAVIVVVVVLLMMRKKKVATPPTQGTMQQGPPPPMQPPAPPAQ